MIYTWRTTILNWLTDAIIMQLFLTSFSLPILAAWSMSISWMSLAGNMLFTPFLFAALLSCSLLFFAILLQLPTALLGWFTHYCCSAWLWCMSWSSPSWQLSLSAPVSAGVLCIITPLTLLFMSRYPCNRWHLLSAAAANLLVITIGLMLFGKA